MDSVMLDVEAMKKRFVGDGKTDPVAAVKEKAKSDIKPLEDSIMTDLQTLHNLRKMFIVDLRGRIKKHKICNACYFNYNHFFHGYESVLENRRKYVVCTLDNFHSVPLSTLGQRTLPNYF
ncbi:unnamed protein product [Dibothriocephalus latus]|uniref:Uncharacterized protein n=1 Tax=Dibothriocephalus latus TaxID=60516 RepID=A0A3P7LT59_DIBLA|nr:unnamed protein product [Dibothriocephalus latus]